MTNKPYHRTNEEIAALLRATRAKSDTSRKVHAHVLARVEIAMFIAEELSK